MVSLAHLILRSCRHAFTGVKHGSRATPCIGAQGELTPRKIRYQTGGKNARISIKYFKSSKMDGNLQGSRMKYMYIPARFNVYVCLVFIVAFIFKGP